MNEEIKEIITRMASYTIHYDCCSEGDAEEDIDKLLDYITNLQNRITELEAGIQEANDNATWWHNRYNAMEEINKQHQELNGTLRNENERLKEKLNVDLKWALRCDDLFKERNNYESRIEKALEYIQDTNNYLEIRGDFDGYVTALIDKEHIDNLLNILQDKEEV